MTAVPWTLGGEEIPFPAEFRVDPFDIERKERAASGLMRKDYIATKERFTLFYPSPTLAEFALFSTLRALHEFLDFTFVRNSIQETVSVEMTMTFEGEYQDPESWKNLSVILEEE